MLRKWPYTSELVLLMKLGYGFGFVPKIPQISVRSEMERPSWDYLWRWITSVGQSERNLRFQNDKPVRCPTFHLYEGLGKGIENSKSHSSLLARFDRKMSVHFSLVSPADLWPVGPAQRKAPQVTIYKYSFRRPITLPGKENE